MCLIIKLTRASGGYPDPICDRCARGDSEILSAVSEKEVNHKHLPCIQSLINCFGSLSWIWQFRMRRHTVSVQCARVRPGLTYKVNQWVAISDRNGEILIARGSDPAVLRGPLRCTRLPKGLGGVRSHHPRGGVSPRESHINGVKDRLICGP